MECPKCGLLNPASAVRCDCGYDFASHVVREPYLASDERTDLALPCPQAVLIALALLTLGLGLSGMRSWIEWSHTLQNIDILDGKDPGVVAFVTALVVGYHAVWGLCIFAAGRAYDRARVAVLTLTAVEMLLSLGRLWYGVLGTPATNSMKAIEMVLQLSALVLLFQKQSSRWFWSRKRRARG